MKQYEVLNKTKLVAIQFALSWVYMASGYFGRPSYAKDIPYIMKDLDNEDVYNIRVSRDYYDHAIKGIKNTIRKIGKLEVQWFCKDVLERALKELKDFKVEFVD